MTLTCHWIHAKCHTCWFFFTPAPNYGLDNKYYERNFFFGGRTTSWRISLSCIEVQTDKCEKLLYNSSIAEQFQYKFITCLEKWALITRTEIENSTTLSHSLSHIVRPARTLIQLQIALNSFSSNNRRRKKCVSKSIPLQNLRTSWHWYRISSLKITPWCWMVSRWKRFRYEENPISSTFNAGR